MKKKERGNMPNIRPISDLRNSANDISDFCRQTGEQVYITQNGTVFIASDLKSKLEY
jgi:PHD/YefM family antitoxin component YafN of YafNO toxin-antitoxin module